MRTKKTPAATRKSAAGTAPAATRRTASAAGGPPVARFRLRVTAGDAIAIGPGKIALLEAIGETGSLTAAAKHLDMSYRRAWLLLDAVNRSLKHPAVDSAIGGQHGGGSQLTDTGRALIDRYRRIERTAAEACAAEIRQLLSLLAR